MASDVNKRVQRHRDGLRAAGLRPVQIWLPDTRRVGFAEECRRQANIIRQAKDRAGDDRAWAEASDTDGWE